MPNAASFQGSDVAHLLFTAICTFPNTVLHHHYFTATFSTCCGRQAALKSQDWRQNTSTAPARLAFHGEKNPMHFGMHGLLPNAATPSPSNIPAREMRFFLPKARAQTHLWVSHTHTHARAPRKGSEILPLLLKGGRGTPRPRQPLLAGSIWLQLPAAARWNARQQSLLLRGPGEQTGHSIYTLKGVTHPDTTARQPDKHRR